MSMTIEIAYLTNKLLAPTRLEDKKYYAETFEFPNTFVHATYARDPRTRILKPVTFDVTIRSTGETVTCASDARQAAAIVVAYDAGISTGKETGGATMDQYRKDMIESGVPEQEAAKADVRYSTVQLQEKFEVLQFAAPFVIVKRKEDRRKGTMMFTHSPREYFDFVADAD